MLKQIRKDRNDTTGDTCTKDGNGNMFTNAAKIQALF